MPCVPKEDRIPLSWKQIFFAFRNVLNTLALCVKKPWQTSIWEGRFWIWFWKMRKWVFSHCCSTSRRGWFPLCQRETTLYHKVQLGYCSSERSLSLLRQPTSWIPDIQDFNAFIVLIKSCKCNEHALGDTTLASSTRTAEEHLYTTPYDSSLTLWPSDTVCVACTWPNETGHLCAA